MDDIKLSIGRNKKLNAIRETRLSGKLANDLNGNLLADAQLSEAYSDNNLLKRQNTNDWETDGTGITVDVHMRWLLNEEVKLAIDITDLYSDFSLHNLGYSEGTIDTDGTYINSIGGIA